MAKSRHSMAKDKTQPLPEKCNDGPLPSVKYERFCRFLFEGMGVEDAFEKAGFKRNSGNAFRLKADERIVKRLRELHEQAARVAAPGANRQPATACVTLRPPHADAPEEPCGPCSPRSAR